jgi:dCMP deaminase
MIITKTSLLKLTGGHGIMQRECRPANLRGKHEKKAVLVMKREDYLSWDEYFMGVALLSAQRSKDPSTQVGACVVSEEKKILSMGYNGMPTGCNDDRMPWESKGDPLKTKYIFVCHAELNAILNAGGVSLKGGRMYTTLFPCNECAKAIIQSGVREVVYLSDKYADSESVTAAKRMFDLVGVDYRRYEPRGRSLSLAL